jgi:hypothetical protein
MHFNCLPLVLDLHPEKRTSHRMIRPSVKEPISPGEIQRRVGPRQNGVKNRRHGAAGRFTPKWLRKT